MNKMLIFLLLVVFAVVGWSMMSNRNTGFRSVSPNEFAQLIADTSSIQLVDVRTPSEYAEAHIPGAVLINVQDTTFMAKAKAQLSPNRPVAVYCRSGRRSATAASMLVRDGYEVINLKGGIVAWQDAGMKTER